MHTDTWWHEIGLLLVRRPYSGMAMLRRHINCRYYYYCDVHCCSCALFLSQSPCLVFEDVSVTRQWSWSERRFVEIYFCFVVRNYASEFCVANTEFRSTCRPIVRACWKSCLSWILQREQALRLFASLFGFCSTLDLIASCDVNTHYSDPQWEGGIQCDCYWNV